MAKKNKVTVNEDVFDQLEDEIKNLQRDIGNYFSRETSRRLSDIATQSIKQFYDDYPESKFKTDKFGHPYYKRHYQFKKNAFKPYRNSNTKNNKYYGGIRLTPELFNDVYEIDKYKVFGMVMGCVIDDSDMDNPDIDFDSAYALGGYHGPFSILNNDPPPTRPDPIAQILSGLDELYENQDSIINEAYSQSVKKGNYKLLK